MPNYERLAVSVLRLKANSFVYSSPIFEPWMTEKYLASSRLQRYDTGDQKHEKRSPPLPVNISKGLGASLTTEPTTHHPVLHGTSMDKEGER